MKALAITLMVLFAAVAARAAEPIPEQERLQLANGLFAREMYALALTEYESYLKDFPQAAEADVAAYRDGECLRALKRYAEADQQFKRVIDTYPQSPYRFRAAFRRADIHLDTGDPKAAKLLYDEVLAANPPADIAAGALFFQAGAAEASGDAATAESGLDRVNRDYPDSEYRAYAQLKLGTLRAARAGGKASDADLKLFQQALDHAPTDRVAAEALFQLAEAHFARGEFDRSAAYYARLQKEHSADERASAGQVRGAWAAHNAGLYADALRIAEQCLPAATGETREDWLYLKANCERQLVRDAQALSTYEELLTTFPEGRLASAARYEKAVTLYRMGRYEDAITAARTVALTDQNRKDVYWLLAEAFAALKRDDDAVQYYRLIATEFPQSDVAADATYRLAYQLQLRNDHLEAAHFFDLLAANFPQHKLAPQALFAAGFCLSAAKKDQEAVRDWTSLIEKYPQDSHVEEALYRKSLGEMRLDRSEESRRSLNQLLEKFPNSTFVADAHFWLGALLREAGQAQAAEHELRLALKAHPRVELEHECQLQLALALHARGVFPEAADLLHGLLASPARKQLTPSLLQWLAEYDFTQGQADRCAEAAQALVAVSTTDASRQTGWSLLGRAETARNHAAAAATAFEEALKIPARTPFAAEAALRLGEFKLAANDDAPAVRYFEQAAALAAADTQAAIRARAYAGLGRAAKARGDTEAASRYFMSVAVLYDDPELVPESLYEAARALEQLGRHEESLKAMTELRERYPKSTWAQRDPAAAPGK